MSQSSKSLNWSVANQASEIRRANEIFNAFAQENNIPISIRRKINMVIDEMLNNIISYAYEDAGKHLIDLNVALSGRELVLSIADDGVPFDPFQTETPNVSKPLETRSIGGLGVHLVRNIMDEVSYERSSGQNVTTLIKLLD